ncbi:MAG: LytR family transcriptional regulator [Ruminococcaceae bacterium]|nr:LytR family transcriptional regulator [Oscillospiraceae bacterium]
MLPSLRNFAITFIVSLFIFAALAFFLADFAMENFSGGFASETEAETETAEETVGVFNPFENTEENVTTTIQGTSFNFILVGLDYQRDVFDDYHESMSEYLSKALAGVQDDGVAQMLTYEMKRDISADAILVGRVDKEDHRLVLTALSGNTRVFVDGVHTSLGSVFVDKGLEFFIGKVSAMTGFAFDYYGVVSIPTMESIIDNLGGLSFKVPCDMEYEDPVEGLTISFKAGSQWLSGAEAMQVLRYADYENRDISRMAVLREMAASMLTSINKITTLANAPDLYKNLKNGISTNLRLADFTDNLDLIFRIGDFEVVNYEYPGRMTVDNGDPMFVPDTAKALAALLQYRS